MKPYGTHPQKQTPSSQGVDDAVFMCSNLSRLFADRRSEGRIQQGGSADSDCEVPCLPRADVSKQKADLRLDDPGEAYRGA